MGEAKVLLVAFLMLYIVQAVLDAWLEWINLKRVERCGDRVPQALQGHIDASKMAQIASYSVAKGRLSLLGTFVSESLLLAILVSGFMVSLDRLLAGWGLPLVLSGVLFFLVPILILYVAGLPFAYVHAFVIEQRFGFNRSTLRLWVVDHLKSGLISLVLFSLLLGAVLWMIELSPDRWWLWGFFIVSSVQVLLAVLYPVLIAPLFNRFEPLRDAALGARITSLMEQNGIRVTKILQMNAGLRSRHTNAYFTGLGKTKQIVLYDTLLEAHPQEEILAVLAHEAGHFTKRHILKQLLLFEATLLVGFYLTHLLLTWPALTSAFGFESTQAYIGLFVLAIVWQKAGFFLQPLAMAVSRRFERESDRFASRFLKTGEPLIAALRRMAADNLSNLNPHPLYVRFHYSHPPLVERIELLQEVDCAAADPGAPCSRRREEARSC